ncbi:PR-1-like protein [Macrolepiota fuliginosa MF-IS2]|uniref:PR-1-like protein n=1 Tax=Macrolepiota fuliginosa MF-IS2 TaxID=1400762 RepID=A0A9P5X1S3_9AGAR|nr:PR-1-like protein [Macrolepiota fuliginosa MF-IS2]
MKFTIASLIALATFAAATPTKRDQFSDQALSSHNSARAHYGAQPLKYDNNLAAGAASYAGQCHWGHSGGNFGENLYATSGSGGNIQGAVNSWVGESSKYDYNHPGFSAATGHFTQVVWKATTTLGCGTHHCTTGSPFGSGDWTYIVCRYTPPGNFLGQFPQNVGRPQ